MYRTYSTSGSRSRSRSYPRLEVPNTSFIGNSVNAAASSSQLQEAILLGEEDRALELIHKGADINIFDSDGTPLLSLAIAKKLESVAFLLLEKGVSVNATNRYKITPLMAAAVSSGTTLLNELIRRGADVNAKDRVNNTALLSACYASNECNALQLIKAGADVNAANNRGDTPLRVCLAKNLIAVTAVLKSKGSTIRPPSVTKRSVWRAGFTKRSMQRRRRSTLKRR
jgi:ankyrin repeat protein